MKTPLINIIWLIINKVKEEMDIETSPNDLGQSHRIGNLKNKKERKTNNKVCTVPFKT